jgi:hypothetical protein
MIDSLGKRYGMLPSDILSRATTFDLYIMDASLTFENYHHKKAMNNDRDPMPDFTTNELQDILNKSRSQ